MSNLLAEYNMGPQPFSLLRMSDETGVSGMGVVAEGVQFSDGSAALRWLTEFTSTAIYASMDDVRAIHGHGGKTKIVFHKKAWRHGADTAVHDRCENAQWTSILDDKPEYKNEDILRGVHGFHRPTWAKARWNDDYWFEFLTGYLCTAAKMTREGGW